MGMLLIIIGAVLIAMCLLLMIVNPIVGVLGIAAGVGAIIYGRRYRKQQKDEKQEINSFIEENEKISQFQVAGFDYYQDQLKPLLITENDDYKLSGKRFIEDVGEKTYEYYTEWYDAELRDEPENEFDPKAIAVYVEDEKIGYVARKDQDEIRTLDIEKTEVEIYGGRYKDIESEYGDDWEVVKGETPYKATLYIKSR